MEKMSFQHEGCMSSVSVSTCSMFQPYVNFNNCAISVVLCHIIVSNFTAIAQSTVKLLLTYRLLLSY